MNIFAINGVMSLTSDAFTGGLNRAQQGLAKFESASRGFEQRLVKTGEAFQSEQLQKWNRLLDEMRVKYASMPAMMAKIEEQQRKVNAQFLAGQGFTGAARQMMGVPYPQQADPDILRAKWLHVTAGIMVFNRAAKGVLELSTAAVQAYKGDWDGVQQTIERLPFGIGMVATATSQLIDAISGQAEQERLALGYAQERAELANMELEARTAIADVVAPMNKELAQEGVPAWEQKVNEQRIALEKQQQDLTSSIYKSMRNAYDPFKTVEVELPGSGIKYKTQKYVKLDEDATYAEAEKKAAVESKAAWDVFYKWKAQQEGEGYKETDFNKFMAKGRQVSEDMLTPGEKYANRVGQLNAMVELGALGWGDYARAVAQAKQALDAASPAGGGEARAGFERYKKEGEAIREQMQTPAEKYANTIGRSNALMEAGALGQSDYARAAMKAKELLPNGATGQKAGEFQQVFSSRYDPRALEQGAQAAQSPVVAKIDKSNTTLAKIEQNTRNSGGFAQ